MRDVDKLFLKIFKDLKITHNNQSTEDNPKYICYIGKQAISRDKVVEMVKEYQDEIVKMLLEQNAEE